MIQVKFGFNTLDTLAPLMMGAELGTGIFVDYISVNDRNYLVTENQDEDKEINVREVLQDFYGNGTTKVYSNNYKNCDASRLETILNSNSMRKEVVQFGLARVLRDNGLDVQDSNLEFPTDNFSVVGVDSDVFETARRALRGSHYSFAQLHQRVKVLEAELSETKKLAK